MLRTFAQGQKVQFNYNRNYMQEKRHMNHDGEIVTVKSLPFESNGIIYYSVENQFNGIYPAMATELTAI